MVTKEQLAQAMLRLEASQEKISNELKNSNLELKSSQEKTDEQMKITDEKMRETQESLKRIGIMVGNISNNQGDIAEEFFYNSLAHDPTLAGISYDHIDKNITRHSKSSNIQDEFDLVLVNGKDIAIIETKYKAHTSDIERLINKKYTNFKKLYPEYKDYTHHLGLASFNINEDVKEMASQNNVILLQRKGDIIETIIPTA
ncbi:MAG: hypothetical protein U9O56_04110 [Campylobacterota bacterium]|nr:hypothetical protein [Campylobacterota bacterium]